MQFIDLKTQYQTYKEDIDAAIHEVLDSGQYILGPQVSQLEQILAAYVGVEHCITASSGTDTLLIALLALGIQPGDEVITVPFTWISTGSMIKLAGATPVFVDIEPGSYNMDPLQLEAAITPRTKAIIPVSMFGQMANLTAINEIANRHGIAVVEDGAQSFGALHNGQRCCGASTIGSTSFFPAKLLGCYGDGGALFTRDATLAARMRAIHTHGGEKRHHYPLLGVNGRFDTIQAAVLLAKWPHYSDELQARAKIAARYSQALSECCQVPHVSEENVHAWGYYTVEHPERDLLAQSLKELGIPSAIYYPVCLHQQPLFSDLGYALGDFPVAEATKDRVLSLPMHPWLTEEEQDKIINAVQVSCLATA